MSTAKASAPQHVDLSLVVNLAHGGRLAHATFRSLDENVQRFLAAGYIAEVILVFDGGSEDTREYLAEYQDKFFAGASVIRLDVMNRDLGLSRNSGVAAASGKYVVFSDADNLYSPTWFVRAFRQLEEGNGHEIAHPEVVVTFEARDTLWRMTASTDPGFDPGALAESNHWDAVCMVQRATVEAVPYAASLQSPGYGPEDWHWNIETLAAGWDHVPVPETVMFYRVKQRGSLLSLLDSNGVVLAPSEFLARPRPQSSWANASPRRSQAARTEALKLARVSGRGVLRSLRWVGRIHPRVQRFGSRMRPVLAELVSPLPADPTKAAAAESARLRDQFPSWLRREWRAINRLEPALFPSESVMRRMGRWSPSGGNFAAAYWELIDRLTFEGAPPDYLFLVPWMIPGGATTVIANYLLAIREAEPEAKIAVLVTEPRRPEWIPNVHLGDVHFVEVPATFQRLVPALQDRLVASLVVQLAPRVVHLINSHIGYRVIARYARPMRARAKLFISLFTIDQDAEGRQIHPILDSVRDYVDELDGLFVDNVALRDRLIELLALPAELFFVHFQPVGAGPPAKTRAATASRSARMKVLWAGRLDRQKRPDLLIEIAERSAALKLPIDYFASGLAVLDGGEDLVDRLTAAGVTVLGAYEDTIASIPQTFDVLLNTSQWEGLPLVLIDAARQDLTLVAAPVGGVVDFIKPGKTGFLVDRFDDVDDYTRVLGQLAADPRLMRSTRRAARALADTRHNWEVFTATLHHSAGYLE